jgi:hypothetical protein
MQMGGAQVLLDRSSVCYEKKKWLAGDLIRNPVPSTTDMLTYPIIDHLFIIVFRLGDTTPAYWAGGGNCPGFHARPRW